MLIDWFTVGAQVVNFVILVWLMKHFLYKPILNAIDAREKRIASELADANAKRTEAEKERADFENKNKAFDDQRSALLSKATGDAKAEGAQLLDKARKDADQSARHASGRVAKRSCEDGRPDHAHGHGGGFWNRPEGACGPRYGQS